MTIDKILPPAVTAARTVRSLRAGETLFRSGSPSVGIFEVVSGRVRMTRTGPRGQDTVLYTAGAGDPLAEAAVFSRCFQCDAVAVVDSVVRLYPKELLLAEFNRNPKFTEAYAAMLARNLMNLRTRFERLSLHSARDRVWHYLAVNAGANCHAVTLPGTLKEFAAELGLTHEVLYRTLARMAEDDEIERTGTTIRIIDRR